MRTLEWNDDRSELTLIDQRVLPARLEYVACQTCNDVVIAIHQMTVRGAPAIGVAAGFGLALAALEFAGNDLQNMIRNLSEASNNLLASRPTAANLGAVLKRLDKNIIQKAGNIEQLKQDLVSEAKKIAEEDVATNLRMAKWGASLINDGDTILHHCNTGSLAAVDWGTALGCVRLAHEQGRHVHVLVDETRPRLQGSRLTAWELQQYGIPFEIIVDGAAGHFLQQGMVNKVMFGADRVATNGDVVNKIGSYMLALAANANHVPVYSVFPATTVDVNFSDGTLIPIEERGEGEVLDLQFENQPVVPQGAHALNPAFDMVPHHLFTALVTDQGIVEPPFDANLPHVLAGVILE